MTEPPARSHGEEAIHRTQVELTVPWLASNRGDEASRDVLVAGVDVARWPLGLDPTSVKFVGVELREELVAETRKRFPAARFESFDRSAPSLPVGDASLDAALCIGVVQGLSQQGRLSLVHELWRATRPGGRLLFLEEFVFWGRKSLTVAPVSILGFMDLLLKATAGRVVLEHMESIRYPDEDAYRAGLLSLTRLGP